MALKSSRDSSQQTEQLDKRQTTERTYVNVAYASLERYDGSDRHDEMLRPMYEGLQQGTGRGG
jgi:hypothetical protein